MKSTRVDKDYVNDYDKDSGTAASRPLVAADVSPWLFSDSLRVLRYLLFKSLLRQPRPNLYGIQMTQSY